MPRSGSEVNNRNSEFIFFRKVILFLQKNINKFGPLKPLEHNIVKRYAVNRIDRLQPVFIIGAPRTGSTLLYQLLLNRFDFSYITNIASLFYSCPFTVTLLFGKYFGKYSKENYASKYGYINGLMAPSEAGPLIDYWFGKDMTSINISQKHISHVKNSITAMSAFMGGPFLLKSLKLSLKINELEKIFPNSVFIHIKRKPVFVAQSLILTRRALYNDEAQWWSYPLPNQTKLTELAPFQQAAYQIKTIWDYIETERKKLTTSAFLEIQYEDICNHPESILLTLKKELSRSGIMLKEGKKESSYNFKASEKRRLSEKEWDELQSIVSRIFQ